MTEQEWLASTDPQAMLYHLNYRHIRRELDGAIATAEVARKPPLASGRKLRLWVEACRALSHWGAGCHGFYDLDREPMTAAQAWTVLIDESLPLAVRAALLRCVVGNPWRPVTVTRTERCLDGCWSSPAVLSLARAAYEERGRKCEKCDGKGGLEYEPGCVVSECRWCRGACRIDDGTLDPVRLVILADALEDAGADSADLLAHLRSPGPHARGCWAIDLVLGKE